MSAKTDRRTAKERDRERRSLSHCSNEADWAQHYTDISVSVHKRTDGQSQTRQIERVRERENRLTEIGTEGERETDRRSERHTYRETETATKTDRHTEKETYIEGERRT